MHFILEAGQIVLYPSDLCRKLDELRGANIGDSETFGVKLSLKPIRTGVRKGKNGGKKGKSSYPSNTTVATGDLQAVTSSDGEQSKFKYLNESL